MPNERRFRVLVVDDQRHVRNWARAVLASMGITDVSEAEDGRAAIAAVSAPGVHFDLILCDLRMPGQDGIETLRALATLGIQSGVAIVSGEDERIIDTSALLTRAHGLRFLGAVAKPVTSAKIESLLVRLQHRPTPPGSHAAIIAPVEDLDAAFARREFRLVYQPKVSMKTGEMIGVEALVRWEHPQFGMFPPSAFVPMIEESPNYSVRLADYTLEEAIACAGRAAVAGRALHVAVNLSRRTCDRLELPDMLDRLCAEHGVRPSQVTLEITERAVAHDAVHLLDVVARLRLKGFLLAIDDFGTGESGLAQVKRVPFTELKIDREFVDGCSTSTTQRSVVEASIALAKRLHMTSVAEGVQSRRDWDVLVSLGCDAVQGFYVSTPLEEESLAAWEHRSTPFMGGPDLEPDG